MESKVTKIQSLSKTKFLSLYEAEYKNKLGKDKKWIIASRKNEEMLNAKFFENQEDKADAVVIAAFHKTSKKLVVIRQFRVPLNDYVYELVAGLVDEGEDNKVTLARELKEETGLDLCEIIDRGKDKLYLSAGMTDESANFVYCTCDGKISDEYLEEDETIETILVSREDAQKLIKGKEKMDVKCFLVLQSFALLGEELFEVK